MVPTTPPFYCRFYIILLSYDTKFFVYLLRSPSTTFLFVFGISRVAGRYARGDCHGYLRVAKSSGVYIIFLSAPFLCIGQLLLSTLLALHAHVLTSHTPSLHTSIVDSQLCHSYTTSIIFHRLLFFGYPKLFRLPPPNHFFAILPLTATNGTQRYQQQSQDHCRNIQNSWLLVMEFMSREDGQKGEEDWTAWIGKH